VAKREPHPPQDVAGVIPRRSVGVPVGGATQAALDAQTAQLLRNQLIVTHQQRQQLAILDDYARDTLGVSIAPTRMDVHRERAYRRFPDWRPQHSAGMVDDARRLQNNVILCAQEAIDVLIRRTPIDDLLNGKHPFILASVENANPEQGRDWMQVCVEFSFVDPRNSQGAIRHVQNVPASVPPAPPPPPKFDGVLFEDLEQIITSVEADLISNADPAFIFAFLRDRLQNLREKTK
jgi:hypothetical protein